jgi:Mrp family chromosome partitioning ATPase
MGLADQSVMQSSAGYPPNTPPPSALSWVPVYTDASRQVAVLSIGFLLKNSDEAVIWRGPKKNSMIRQFVNDVVWGDRDFLLVDTPPGSLTYVLEI